MITIQLSSNGLWYHTSNNNEQLCHLFRIGSSVRGPGTLSKQVIYEVIIWRLKISWIKPNKALT